MRGEWMEFGWDAEKARQNLNKHAVSFQEAATVFGDALSATFHDPDHSASEDRFITIGTSVSGRLLILSHADRQDRVRIISARKATRKERKLYEEGEFDPAG